MKRLIVDSCVWFALLDESDDKHCYADKIKKVLDLHELIVPFPTLYETINTRLARNEYHQMEGLFGQLYKEGHVTLVPDTEYRPKIRTTFFIFPKSMTIGDTLNWHRL